MSLILAPNERWRIAVGDCREVLASLPAESVNCVVTSPPYWGLRDYGVEGQIGLEETPYEFVDALVAVFEAVRRVLRKDGTLWLNLGDCYATGGGRVGDHPGGGEQGARWRGDVGRDRDARRRALGSKHAKAAHAMGPRTPPNRMPIAGLKPKDLVGAPWRVAFALQQAGWWLRADMIWSKPNPMPESVTDRPTRSHEYLFLLTKGQRYFYDAAAIAEPLKCPADSTKEDASRAFTRRRGTSPVVRQGGAVLDGATPTTRNRRTVWTVPTAPFAGAHFATFPPALIEPCVLAGAPVDGVVLDPFAGSGTTGVVALKHQRRFVGIELNARYAELARDRIVDDQPLLNVGSVA